MAHLLARNLTSALLHGCGVELRPGEIVALRGESGAGKTVLLRAIADLDPHDGEAWLDGAARSAMSGAAWRKRTRFIAAEAAWWADHVAEHFRHVAAARDLAQCFGMPRESLDWRVDRLSTGEKQRLGLARALEDAPAALLLDEPTAALDRDSEALVEAEIRRRAAEGAAALLVTHDDAQAERLASRTLRIAGGRLAAP